MSQGASEEEAIENLREAIELHFEPPVRLGRLKPLPFREVKRCLERVGFVEATQRGSHVKFVRRSGEVVDTAIVPHKSEIPVGTLHSILH